MPRSKTTPLDRPDKLGGHRVNIALLKEATLVACSLVNPAIFGFISAISEFERSSREVDPKFAPPVSGWAERFSPFLFVKRPRPVLDPRRAALIHILLSACRTGGATHVVRVAVLRESAMAVRRQPLEVSRQSPR